MVSILPVESGLYQSHCLPPSQCLSGPLPADHHWTVRTVRTAAVTLSRPVSPRDRQLCEADWTTTLRVSSLSRLAAGCRLTDRPVPADAAARNRFYYTFLGVPRSPGRGPQPCSRRRPQLRAADGCYRAPAAAPAPLVTAADRPATRRLQCRHLGRPPAAGHLLHGWYLGFMGPHCLRTSPACYRPFSAALQRPCGG